MFHDIYRTVLVVASGDKAQQSLAALKSFASNYQLYVVANKPPATKALKNIAGTWVPGDLPQGLEEVIRQVNPFFALILGGPPEIRAMEACDRLRIPMVVAPFAETMDWYRPLKPARDFCVVRNNKERGLVKARYPFAKDRIRLLPAHTTPEFGKALLTYCDATVRPMTMLYRRKSAPKRESLSYHHGSREILAAYASVAPKRIDVPGFWMHGWYPKHYQVSPILIASHKGESGTPAERLEMLARIREDEWQWVARQDEVEYLKGHGYRHVEAIGLPFAYLPDPKVERRPGSLLVVPPHGRKQFFENDPRAEAYAELILSIRDRFSHVAVSVTQGDYLRGEWRHNFEKRGIEVIIGSDPAVPEPLMRVKRMFSSFDYVTTNAFGSHIAYAAASGAKVSVFGPYAEWDLEQTKVTFAAKMMPEIAELIVRSLSEAELKRSYPFLFTAPEEAVQRTDWGLTEIGADCALSPEDVRMRFAGEAVAPPEADAKPEAQEKPENRDSVAILRSFMKMDLDPKTRLKVMRKLEFAMPLMLEGRKAQFSITSPTELNRVSHVKEPHTAEWVENLPKGSVLWDVGANIGLFTVLAAQNPNVERVVAIEPSAANFGSLVRNIRLNGLSDKVIAIQAGLGPVTGIRSFNLHNTKVGGALHSFGELVVKAKDATPSKEWAFLWKIDDLAAIDGMPFPTHLKIDVDGYEPQVLAGAEATIRDGRLVGVQIEVMEQPGEETARRWVTTRLEESGLDFVEMIHHGENSVAIDLRFSRKDDQLAAVNVLRGLHRKRIAPAAAALAEGDLAGALEHVQALGAKTHKLGKALVTAGRPKEDKFLRSLRAVTRSAASDFTEAAGRGDATAARAALDAIEARLTRLVGKPVGNQSAKAGGEGAVRAGKGGDKVATRPAEKHGFVDRLRRRIARG